MRARTHTHTNTHTNTHTHTCKCTCKHARVRAHTPHTYKQRTRKQSAHAEGKCGTAHKMATAANPARRAQARYAHAADLARARRAAVVVHSRNACLSERHTRQLIAGQIEFPAGATRGGPSQPSYGPHVKARACVYAHPCVLGTHCPHPSLPHSTGTHTLSDTHTHTDQLVPHMHTRALCVSEAPGGAGTTGKSMRKHCRPSAPRAHICVCACECVSASVCVCVCVCVSACG